MRNRRALAGLLVAMLLAAVSFGRAEAQGGYGGADGCAASTCTFQPGLALTMPKGQLKTVVIDQGGFGPLVLVTVTLRSDPVVLGTFTADAQGRVRATVTLPANIEVGNHSLTISGTDAAGRPYSVSSPVVVTAAATSTTQTASATTQTTRTSASGTGDSSGFLARTGRTLIPAAAMGALLLVGGGLLTTAARRRQRES